MDISVKDGTCHVQVMVTKSKKVEGGLTWMDIESIGDSHLSKVEDFLESEQYDGKSDTDKNRLLSWLAGTYYLLTIYYLLPATSPTTYYLLPST
jgi:hypothetical protein